MPALKFTIELVEKFDIQVGRLVGIVKDPKYRGIVEEYELDMTQCYLWWDICQLLSYILEKNDYEDFRCDYSEFGLAAKKVMAELEDKFMYLKQLLAQYEILHDNEAIGKILTEMIEDVQSVYRSIRKEVANILSTQQEINKLMQDSGIINVHDVDD